MLKAYLEEAKFSGPEDADLILKCVNDTPERYFEVVGYVRSISSGEIRFTVTSDLFFQPGDRASCHINLPTGGEMYVNGEIWPEGKEDGLSHAFIYIYRLQFIGLSIEQSYLLTGLNRDRIQKKIQENAKKQIG